MWVSTVRALNLRRRCGLFGSFDWRGDLEEGGGRQEGRGGGRLPRRFANTGEIASASHIAQSDTRESEFAVESARTARHAAAVDNAAGARIAGKLLEFDLGFIAIFGAGVGVFDEFFEGLSFFPVTVDDSFTLFVACDHTFFGHWILQESVLASLVGIL